MKTRAIVLSLLLAAALPAVAVQAGDGKPADQSQPAADPAPPATPQEQGKEAPPRSAHVVRAVFTTGVVDREPVDEIAAVPAGLDRVYYFTEIKDLEGSVITHRWMLDGETVAQVPIDVEGPRWRAYSVKDIQPGETGTWTVQVVDADGNVLVEADLPASAQPLEHGQS